MSVRDRFTGAADRTSTWRREGLPDPAKLVERGILTRESLDWLAAREPKPPAPELHIDDPALRQEAREEAEKEYRATVNRLRRAFLARSAKGRLDFDTAREYRDRDRER